MKNKMTIAEKEKKTKELIAEYQKTKDKSIAQELCTMYESTIQKIAWKNKNRGEHEDLVQVCYVQFMKCLNMYKTTSKSSFWLYLRNSLMGELKRYSYENWNMHVDANRVNYISHVRQAEKKLRNEGIRPTSEMLALELGVSTQKINEELDIASVTPALFSTPIAGTDEKGDACTLGEEIADSHDEYKEREDHQNLTDAIESLDDNEKRILHMYFFENMSISEITRKKYHSESPCVKEKVEIQIQKILEKIRVEMGIYVSMGQKKGIKLRGMTGTRYWYKKGIVNFFDVEGETKKIYDSLSEEEQKRLQCLSKRQLQTYVLSKKYNAKTIAKSMGKPKTDDIYGFMSKAKEKLGEKTRDKFINVIDKKFFSTTNDITKDPRVRQAMKQLTQKQRQTLYDVHHLHMTKKEIIEKRNMKSKKNVENTRLDAITKIQKILAGEKLEFCADKREQIKEIDDSIVAKLPPKQRMYVESVKKDIPENEIGKKMGMTAGARSALRRRVFESVEKIQKQEEMRDTDTEKREAEFEKTLDDTEREYLFQKQKNGLCNKGIAKVMHLSRHKVEKIAHNVELKKIEYFYPSMRVLSVNEIEDALKHVKLTEREKMIFQKIYFRRQSVSDVTKLFKSVNDFSAFDTRDLYDRAVYQIKIYVYQKRYGK